MLAATIPTIRSSTVMGEAVTGEAVTGDAVMGEAAIGEARPSIVSTTRLDPAALARLRDIAPDETMFQQLVTSFLDNATALVAHLRDAAESGDVDTLRRAAHTFKSNAAAFGATDLAARCAVLEALARAGGVDDAQIQIDALSGEFDLVRAALEVWG